MIYCYIVKDYYIYQPMSSSRQPSPANTLSSHKKKRFDRFIPHSVARNLFDSDQKSGTNTHYQDLLGKNLLA